MFKLVIFDLDGTLLNTLYDLAHSCNYTLQLYGYPTHPVEEYRFFVGNGMAKLIERALPEEARLPDIMASVKRDFLAYYADHSTEYTQPYPGIPELLETLQRKGIALAVASNKIDVATRQLIRRFFPDIRFAVVLGQRDSFPAKPDPAIVNEILTHAGVAKEEALYVGDSGVDVETALNAGVSLVAVLWGFRPKEELAGKGATVFVEKAEDIVTLLSL